MIRLIFWTIVVYLIYRLARLLLSAGDRPPQKISGKQKSRPLDLSQYDVEDAKFHEVGGRK